MRLRNAGHKLVFSEECGGSVNKTKQNRTQDGSIFMVRSLVVGVSSRQADLIYSSFFHLM